MVIDNDHPPPFNLVQSAQKEKLFMQSYLARTGRPWVHHYDTTRDEPRGPPVNFMWPAEFIGHVKDITVAENHW